MTNPTEHEQFDARDPKPADRRRRRIIQGVGIGVMTVSARSALATYGTGNCHSPSAQASINLLNSRPGRHKYVCTGRTPGFWFNVSDPTHPNHGYWLAAGQTGLGERFKDVFLSGFESPTPLRLAQVMKLTGDEDPQQLGAHLSAAYLNLRMGWVPETVLSLADLRAMWAGRGMPTGSYSPVSGVTWNSEQIVGFLTTTMTL